MVKNYFTLTGGTLNKCRGRTSNVRVNSSDAYEIQYMMYVHTSPLLHKSFISKYKYYRPQDRAAFTQCLMTNSTEYPAARI